MASSPSLALSFLLLILILATFTTTTVLATNNLPPSSAPALSPASSAAAKEFLRATCTWKSENYRNSASTFSSRTPAPSMAAKEKLLELARPSRSNDTGASSTSSAA
uniref:Pectinesterase inhibitor domain-containing protein n=1 Tax=Oryza glumipatula TaxID=40148 RepID=A0A0D9ZAW0_9ORYZ